MDMTESIKPKSDQINADDLISGPVTVTIQEVARGSDEQPVNVRLVEFPGRAYRPSKSMRRVMVAAWGAESDVYTGRRMTLFRNPTIKFGKDETGGIQISHMSHLNKPLKTPLTVTRGKRAMFTVQPLVEAQAAPAPPTPMQQMVELMKRRDITEPAAMIAHASQVLGRDIASSKELSEDDITTIITDLTKETTNA